MTDKLKIKATVYWAHLQRKNEMADAYTVDLCNLSDAAVEALEGLGLSVLSNAEKKPEQGRYITCKSQRPITAYDSDGDVIDVDVGNGSKSVCMVGAYQWSYKAKKGSSPSLLKLVISDLVEYNAGAAISADDEDIL